MDKQAIQDFSALVLKHFAGKNDGRLSAYANYFPLEFLSPPQLEASFHLVEMSDQDLAQCARDYTNELELRQVRDENFIPLLDSLEKHAALFGLLRQIRMNDRLLNSDGFNERDKEIVLLETIDIFRRISHKGKLQPEAAELILTTTEELADISNAHYALTKKLDAAGILNCSAENMGVEFAYGVNGASLPFSFGHFLRLHNVGPANELVMEQSSAHRFGGYLFNRGLANENPGQGLVDFFEAIIESGSPLHTPRGGSLEAARITITQEFARLTENLAAVEAALAKPPTEIGVLKTEHQHGPDLPPGQHLQ